jgi:hypothetical protein
MVSDKNIHSLSIIVNNDDSMLLLIELLEEFDVAVAIDLKVDVEKVCQSVEDTLLDQSEFEELGDVGAFKSLDLDHDFLSELTGLRGSATSLDPESEHEVNGNPT